MLPKPNRLKKSTEINAVFKKDASFHEASLLCKYLETSNGLIKPCFTFSKKLKLTVPTKNRLKRQLVHAFKDVLHGNPEFDNLSYDIIFILIKLPSPGVSRYNQFIKEITNLLSKINHV